MARPAGSVSRRDFARLFAVGGSAALFTHPAWAQSATAASACGRRGRRRTVLEGRSLAVRDAARIWR